MHQEGNELFDNTQSENRYADASYEPSLEAANAFEEEGRYQEAVYQLMMAYAIALQGFQDAHLSDGHPALEGLARAWNLACALGDHGLAEHVFEMLEPYLDIPEMERYTHELEAMSLRGLGKPRVSSHEADDIAETLTKDLIKAALNPASASFASRIAAHRRETGEAAEDESQEVSEDEPIGPGSCRLEELVGFEDEIASLQTRGLGFPGGDDEFLQQMMAQHGIPMPHLAAPLVFRARAREDASRLMLAAAAELTLPTIRMRVDDNMFGGTTLCVIAANGFDIRAGLSGSGFMGEGVLVLEDFDLWGAPSLSVPERGYDEADYGAMSFAKGAARALALIRGAIADPRITVMISVQEESDPAVLRAFGCPVDCFDIPLPSYAERCAIWGRLMDDHVSLSTLDRFELVRLSANMPRCDIECAAIEAVEEAFRQSMANRVYVPVSRMNAFDKIAAYQPMDSDEYREIEECLVECLQRDLESYDAQAEQDAS